MHHLACSHPLFPLFSIACLCYLIRFFYLVFTAELSLLFFVATLFCHSIFSRLFHVQTGNNQAFTGGSRVEWGTVSSIHLSEVILQCCRFSKTVTHTQKDSQHRHHMHLGYTLSNTLNIILSCSDLMTEPLYDYKRVLYPISIIL